MCHHLLAAIRLAGLALLIPAAAFAQSSRERPFIGAVFTADAPHIDGVLDEAAWQQANLVDTFVQQEPKEGQPATDRTEVRVIYDKGTSTSASTLCPARGSATEMRRDADRLFDEDNFQVILDTFHDSRNGYMFLTTPLGAKLEQQIFDEGEGGGRGATTSNINRNWDGVWEPRPKSSPTAGPPRSRFRSAPCASSPAIENLGHQLPASRSPQERDRALVADSARLHPDTRQPGWRAGGSQGHQPRPRSALKPFVVGGARNHPVHRNHSQRRDSDVGLDARYGVTAGLNLDSP